MKKERNWKRTAAKQLAEECAIVCNQKKIQKTNAKIDVFGEENAKKVCKKIASMVEKFWNDKLCQFSLDREWLGEHLDEISDRRSSASNPSPESVGSVKADMQKPLESIDHGGK